MVDPATLTRRVLFVWSTEEEVGLNGAAALAARLGPTVRRVHSIDTFVSSESPLESPHFAYARLGEGAGAARDRVAEHVAAGRARRGGADRAGRRGSRCRWG
jgi:putative aminopeptidase FrvX